MFGVRTTRTTLCSTSLKPTYPLPQEDPSIAAKVIFKIQPLADGNSGTNVGMVLTQTRPAD